MTDSDGPAVRNTLTDQVTSRIRDAIKGGMYSTGQLLPSEAELVQRYGVSRNVVRAALDALRHEGLITTVNGVGSYVDGAGVDLLTVVQSGQPSSGPPDVDVETIDNHISAILEVTRPTEHTSVGGVSVQLRDYDLDNEPWTAVVVTDGRNILTAHTFRLEKAAGETARVVIDVLGSVALPATQPER